MNSKEYIQIVKECVTSLSKEDVNDSLIEAMNTLRELHGKLQKQLDYYNVYPRHELTESENLKVLIQNHCEEFGFKYIFTQKDTMWFKKGYYCRYYLHGKEISNLIIFRKQDKNKDTKSIDEITL